MSHPIVFPYPFTNKWIHSAQSVPCKVTPYSLFILHTCILELLTDDPSLHFKKKSSLSYHPWSTSIPPRYSFQIAFWRQLHTLDTSTLRFDNPYMVHRTLNTYKKRTKHELEFSIDFNLSSWRQSIQTLFKFDTKLRTILYEISQETRYYEKEAIWIPIGQKTKDSQHLHRLS